MSKDQAALDPRRRRIPRKLIWIVVGLAILGAFGLGLVFKPRRILKAVKKRARNLYTRVAVTENCVAGPGPLQTCVASDMARLPNHGPVPQETWLFDAGQRRIKLDAARNETVAFQLVLKGGKTAPRKVTLKLGDLAGPGGARISTRRHARRFAASYVWVEPGGYSWGGGGAVLPWPEFYADALIPFSTRCLLNNSGAPGPRKAVLQSVQVPPKNGTNQALWVDLYVPRDQPPGAYQGSLTLSARGQRVELKVQLTVFRARIPDQSSLHAVGELYAPYRSEAVGTDVSSPRWRRMAHCYQQLAHRHRAVFIERMGELKGLDGLDENPRPGAWKAYDAAFDAALTGELFTAARGYLSGPGAGVPVSAWRTPWVQPYNGRLGNTLSEEQIASYEKLARAFATHAAAKKWIAPYFFAYIFDEIEGGQDIDSAAPQKTQEADDEAYLKMAHEQIRWVQEALDRGAKPGRIHLMWTSHANPARWSRSPGIDLSGIIRLWVPNAAAAGTEFLQKRATGAGEQVWFYHAGHPAVGLHSINASGIEMRTWGVIAARYNFTGTFMWAVNLGDVEEPYRKPSYKNSDDRFGNGTLVYPGAGLPTIGLPALSEPLPSMRLKMWRRGLQDAELARLAREAGHRKEVNKLLQQLIPRALSQGRGDAAWPRDSASWNRARVQLLKLASKP